MFTAVVLICMQSNCFAIGGPGFQTEEQCVADLMNKGFPAIQMKYRGYAIVSAQCLEWEERKVES